MFVKNKSCTFIYDYFFKKRYRWSKRKRNFSKFTISFDLKFECSVKADLCTKSCTINFERVLEQRDNL
jgi:hypothetical protein